MGNPAQELIKYGQSLWYDNISRELIQTGGIQRLISESGVRGMTSNPTIFENAISGGDTYDEQINALKGKGMTTDQVFEEIAIKDIGDAADILRPLYDESDGVDGFISIEVSPLLARETQGTIDEAIKLYDRLNRPNIMIKIPGTPEGMPAVRECLERGININITLLFSVENYVDVADTYVAALKARHAKGEPVDKIRSVASFFVSRVDTIVDDRLQEIIAENKDSNPSTAELAQSLLGQFGIANCKLAYKEFQRIFEGPDFADLKAAGAKPQRPLWASTSTKNPDYSDVMYVENLVGPETVNTMPTQTVEATVDHADLSAGATIAKDVQHSESVASQLTEIGVDIPALMLQLQVEGVEKFSKSFNDLNATLEKKL